VKRIAAMTLIRVTEKSPEFYAQEKMEKEEAGL